MCKTTRAHDTTRRTTRHVFLPNTLLPLAPHHKIKDNVPLDNAYLAALARWFGGFTMAKQFQVTAENHAHVRDYLTGVVNDQGRLLGFLTPGRRPELAAVSFHESHTPAALNTWVAGNLSSTGRTRMLNALRQRRHAESVYTWKLDLALFAKVEEAARAQGKSPEAWLETITANSMRRATA